MSRMNCDGLSYVDAQIGTKLADGSFMVDDGCIEVMKELIQRFAQSEQWYVHVNLLRRLLSQDLPGKALIPLLLCLKESDEFMDTEKTTILFLALKLLAVLTQPIQQLIPTEILLGSNNISNLVKEMNDFVLQIHSHFETQDINMVILGNVTGLITKAKQCQGVSQDMTTLESEFISNFLLLYQNLLFPQEQTTKTETNGSQKTPDQDRRLCILRWMFIEGLEHILLDICLFPQKDKWCIALVQLLSLIYQDTEVTMVTVQPDNTNTEAPTSSPSCASPRIPPSTPDITLIDKQFSHLCVLSVSKASKDIHPRQIESTDDQQTGDQFTSSEDENPPNMKNIDNVKEYIKLKCETFATTFVKNCLESLVLCVLCVYLDNNMTRTDDTIDISYLPWLICHFLKPTSLMPQQLEFMCIKNIISDLVINYLVVLVLQTTEQLMYLENPESPQYQDTAHKVYLLVVALQRIFKVILVYYESDIVSDDEKMYLFQLQGTLTSKSDIRHGFVLMLRTCSTTPHSLAILQMLIDANHKFLMMTDNMTSRHQQQPFNLVHFMRDNFASRKMMAQYGAVLECKNFVPQKVLQYIANMMYHVAGDLQRPDILMQIPILQSFIGLLQTSQPFLSLDAYIMMDYMIRKFATKMDSNIEDAVKTLVPELTDIDANERKNDIEKAASWSEEHVMVALETVTEASRLGDQLSLDHVSLLLKKKNISKTRKQISILYVQLGLLTHSQCMEILEKQPITKEDQLLIDYMSKMSQHPARNNDTVEEVLEDPHICEEQIAWLSGFLQDVLYIRMGGQGFTQARSEEPTLQYYVALRQPAPLVHFTEKQAEWMDNPKFRLLLQKLDFLVPCHEKLQVFYRIPTESLPNLQQTLAMIDPQVCDEIDFSCFTEKDRDAMVTDIMELPAY